MFRRLLTRLQSASLRRVVLGDTDLNLTVTRDDDYGLFRGHARYTGSERWGLIEGQGADWDARIAELKAWSELLERCSFYMQISDGNPSQYTTNGFAAHFWRRHVRDAALAELVERDVFLCSWLLGRRALLSEGLLIHRDQALALSKQADGLGSLARGVSPRRLSTRIIAPGKAAARASGGLAA